MGCGASRGATDGGADLHVVRENAGPAEKPKGVQEEKGAQLPGAIENPLDKPSLPPIKAVTHHQSYGARRPKTSNPSFRWMSIGCFRDLSLRQQKVSLRDRQTPGPWTQ